MCFTKLALLTLLALTWTGDGHADQNQPFLTDSVDLQGKRIHSDPAKTAFKRVGAIAEYVLGPGDQLKITVFDGSEPKETLARILPDSTISLAVVSFIKVGGFTVSEVTAILLDKLSLYIRTPSVQVVIDDYTSKTASVFGAVNIRSVTVAAQNSGPGTYPLTGRVTALDLIFLAGGPSLDARLDQVTLTRGGQTYSLDLLKATRSGDDSHNIPIEHGDILRVSGTQQADSRIVILGEVNSPGVHNLSSQANMLEAIAETRGFTEDAAANSIRVNSWNDPQIGVILTVNAERILKGDLSQNINLVDGDIVIVPRDWLTDLNDLLVQLQPIIAWNGLIAPEPILSVGGYSVNDEGFSIRTTADAAAATSALQDFTQQQAIINQVQQNLKNGLRK